MADMFLETTFQPQAVALIVLSAIAVLIDLPPLIWHLQNRNFACASLVVWIVLTNLFNLINASIWGNDAFWTWWQGYGLCDVEAKIILASLLGLPCSLACLVRSLCAVMDTKNIVLSPSRAQKRRNLAIELSLCCGAPLYVMTIHYVIQPNRYNIVAISGCYPTVDRSWPTIALLYVWTIVFGLIDCGYGCLLVIRMHRYRSQFSRILANSNVKKSHFFRMFIMCAVLILVFFPIQLWTFYKIVTTPRLPYSWKAIHNNGWNTIENYPTGGQVNFESWVWVASGFLVFVFFGIGMEARRKYAEWLSKIGASQSVLHNSFLQTTLISLSGSFDSISNKARLFLSKKDSLTVSPTSKHTTWTVTSSEMTYVEDDYRDSGLLKSHPACNVTIPSPALHLERWDEHLNETNNSLV